MPQQPNHPEFARGLQALIEELARKIEAERGVPSEVALNAAHRYAGMRATNTSPHRKAGRQAEFRPGVPCDTCGEEIGTREEADGHHPEPDVFPDWIVWVHKTAECHPGSRG